MHVFYMCKVTIYSPLLFKICNCVTIIVINEKNNVNLLLKKKYNCNGVTNNELLLNPE